jgi:hypothetical protein
MFPLQKAFMRDIQWDQADRYPGMKDDVRRMWVYINIEFCQRSDIARLDDRASHDD